MSCMLSELYLIKLSPNEGRKRGEEREKKEKIRHLYANVHQLYSEQRKTGSHRATFGGEWRWGLCCGVLFPSEDTGPRVGAAAERPGGRCWRGAGSERLCTAHSPYPLT